MMELADMDASNAFAFGRAGSNPAPGTPLSDQDLGPMIRSSVATLSRRATDTVHAFIGRHATPSRSRTSANSTRRSR